MAFRVNNRQCATCIFNRRSPISPKRFDELKAQWAEEDSVQICHHSSMSGGDVGCRGHYEAAKRGDIPHPITGIAESLGLGELRIEQVMGLCESIGWIEFVEVDDKSDL